MIRLKKILNEWFTKAILICFLVLVGIGGMCENPYQTNPNLKLLVGDTTTDYDSIHCSNPVVSPDGNIIYYLRVSADSVDYGYGWGIGAIYSITAKGKDNRLLLNGKFTRLSISHNGKMLAVHSNRGAFDYPEPESLILVLHLDSVAISNIDSFWITAKRIEKIEWASGDNDLYFSTVDYYNFKTTIYRLNLTDSTEEEVKIISGVIGFDLLQYDSVYVDDSIKPQPQIEPVSEKYLIGTYGFMGKDFLMRNLSNGILFTLPDSCEPYGIGDVGSPYWFPDGNTIVFAASPYIEGSGAPAEIWILENVFEQIEE